MRRADSLEKPPMLGKIEGTRRRGWQRMRWLDGITDLRDVSLSKHWERVEDRGAWRAAAHEIAKSRTWPSNWATSVICDKTGDAAVTKSGLSLSTLLLLLWSGTGQAASSNSNSAIRIVLHPALSSQTSWLPAVQAVDEKEDLWGLDLWSHLKLAYNWSHPDSDVLKTVMCRPNRAAGNLGLHVLAPGGWGGNRSGDGNAPDSALLDQSTHDCGWVLQSKALVELHKACPRAWADAGCIPSRFTLGRPSFLLETQYQGYRISSPTSFLLQNTGHLCGALEVTLQANNHKLH